MNPTKGMMVSASMIDLLRPSPYSSITLRLGDGLSVDSSRSFLSLLLLANLPLVLAFCRLILRQGLG